MPGGRNAGRRGLQLDMRRGQSAPHLILVDDIVVDQRPVVQHLQRRGRIKTALRVAADRADAPEQNHRTQAFAAGFRIGPDRRDQTGRFDRVGIGTLRDDPVDARGQFPQ
ncbi:hypothetical protein SDC9_134742 [bioreactor metagenome]|uniref:Uncharacterized protein n=1 Tax=bioreactor metagenome TaxID=1076179 RepID=A0A645DGD5_9ZZZZ